MATFRHCAPCAEGGNFREARVVIDGTPVCAAHALDPAATLAERTGSVSLAAQAEGGMDEEAPAPCGRGCGKPVHRGCCKGTGGRRGPRATAAPQADLQPAKEEPPPRPTYIAVPNDEFPGLTVLGQAATDSALPRWMEAGLHRLARETLRELAAAG